MEEENNSASETTPREVHAANADSPIQLFSRFHVHEAVSALKPPTVIKQASIGHWFLYDVEKYGKRVNLFWL